MIKVLMLGWEFPPHISGGLGTACFGLTKGLHEIGGVDVTFAVPTLLGGEDERFVRLVGLGDAGPGASLAAASSYGAGLTDAAMAYAARVARRFGGEKHFELIHVHDWLTVPAGIEAKRLLGIPLVMHVHSTEFDRAGTGGDSRIRALEQFGMDQSDRIVTVSNYTRQMVIDRYCQNPDKVTTVYNAAHVGKQTLIRPRLVSGQTVAFFGRITYQKGPQYFLRAAHLALRQCPDLQFVMAGAGDLDADMRLLACKLGIDTKVFFPGFLTGQELRHLLGHADLYVMPSVSEPFGISAVEAAEAGIPAILSKQSGVIEVMEHAIKVDHWDVEAIAAGMVKLASDHEFADWLRRRAREQLHGLSWCASAAALYGVYEQLVVARS